MNFTFTTTTKRYLCLITLCYLLPFTLEQQNEEKKYLDNHVKMQRKRSDTRSLPFHRETQLYSRSSRSHLRIHGKKIDALGRDGDKYAKLVIESDNFGRVRIRGSLTNYYLCIKRNSTFIGRKATKSRRCVFYEKYAVNHYTEFLSAYNESWTISVSKRGKMRTGYKGRRGQKTVQFIERASKIIIKTKNVKESLYPGLRDHIEKLLRAYRTKKESTDKERPSKMPYPAGYKQATERKGKIKRREKGMKRRSKKALLKLLRREQRKEEI
ncbi:fibroblast growth factor 18-like [Acropora muricata]|uniref:fibroblast growth factor 18-like n=1 Tax=Acropora millepora TaxID=45264 RepID=UPI0010FCB663|nr:fibroblast growth factor 18-like [Acropora millepora]